MIKTKISNGAANGIHTSTPKPGFAKEPKQAALPTTGRPVLMTPAGPISMRNMRREPTQDELAAEDPPLPDIYQCQKCEFKHRNRQDFQHHIKRHFNANGFQCTECGNTFISLTALESHLYMTHKIRSIRQLDRIDANFRDPIAPKKKELDVARIGVHHRPQITLFLLRFKFAQALHSWCQ